MITPVYRAFGVVHNIMLRMVLDGACAKQYVQRKKVGIIGYMRFYNYSHMNYTTQSTKCSPELK